MLLSIIIPSFQQSVLLKRALESIAEQTFKDYEILIIDGGSKDCIDEVVSAFMHLPLRFYSEPDKGIYDAMNKGVYHSSGVFLYFMGCDDILYDNNVLKKVFEIPYITENHVIYGDVLLSNTGARYYGEFTQFKLLENNISHQAIFCRRDLYKILGMFDIRYKLYADWEFNMRWFNSYWVKRQYIPVIIAIYNVAGFSSSLQDDVFFAEQKDIVKKHFPRIVTYLVGNINKPLHYRLMKALTFQRLAFIGKITDIFSK